jgi:phage shock protein PspC (stress-responsive transcriptional regulator)
MNKILNINLGGYALTIDDDAHEYLAAYLGNIKSRFGESDGRDEIMRDVEARLGELISLGLGARSIVMMPDVQSAVEIMGKPEDFGGEPSASAKTTPPPTSGGTSKSIFDQAIKPGKRLFRDENDAVGAGVCSGLAAYFGFKDPVWMRIIFVLLTVLTGFGILLYFLLWVIVPPARTTAERLEMRGEEINVDTIARELERGGERLQRNARPVASGCVKVLGMAALVFLVLIALSVIGGLGTAWVASIVAFVAALPYLSYISPLGVGATYLAFFCALLLIGLPLVGLGLWIASLVFKFKSPRWLGSGMSITWIAALLVGMVLVGSSIGEYRQSGTATDPIDLSGMTGDTLRIEWANTLENADNRHQGDPIRIRDGRLDMSAWLDLHVYRSNSQQFEVVRNITSRGDSYEGALENARSVDYQLVMQGNTLRVPTRTGILEGKKFRFQNIDLRVYIPVGKYVVFGREINEFVRYRGDEAYDGGGYYHIGAYPNRVFKMTESGLECIDCPGFGDRGHDYDRRYENFTLEGDFDTEILYDDRGFDIQIEANATDKNLIEYIKTGDRLTIHTGNKKTQGRVKIKVRTSTLTELLADNTGSVVIRGFDEGRARIIAKGSSKVRADMQVNELDVTLAGPASLELNGSGNQLDATLSGGALLAANAWRVDDVDVSAIENSKAYVNARNRASVNKDSNSEIKVEGDATVEQKSER